MKYSVDTVILATRPNHIDSSFSKPFLGIIRSVLHNIYLVEDVCGRFINVEENEIDCEVK